jgi:cation diffusion facilitator family transporter
VSRREQPTVETQYERMERHFLRGERVTLIGMAISVVLSVVKIGGGLLGRSHALVADGVESLLDVFGSSLVLGSLRVSSRPPDSKHPYGHGKAEALAALVTASTLVLVSLAIAIASIRQIHTPRSLPEPFTLGILILVVIVKEVLGRFLLREGRDIHSRAVETDAWHHRSDAFTSLAAFVGISLALWKGPAWAAADDWAALFACAIIGYNGVYLFVAALDDVMDAAQPETVQMRIREVAMSVPGVTGTHNLRVRRSGMLLLVDLDVIVDGDMTVRRGHDIAHDVKAALLDSDLRIQNVLVHVEPDEQRTHAQAPHDAPAPEPAGVAAGGRGATTAQEAHR